MKFALVFPGQGSQHAGMGRAAAEAYPAVMETLDEANEALGRDLKKLIFSGPEEELKKTVNTQPAIVAVSIALFRAVQSHVGDAVAMAGHSLGEYSALVASGAVKFADALKIVEKRGQFMQEAVPLGVGGMTAVIGLDADTVAQICADASTAEFKASVANDNCPGQLVISGHVEALEKAEELAKKAGAKRALRLPVSAPFHCPLMQPAGDRLAEALSAISFNAPSFQVLANVDASAYGTASDIPLKLTRQVSEPVLWQDSIRKLENMGVEKFIEVGPGKVLAGLIRRISRSAEMLNVETPESIAALECL